MNGKRRCLLSGIVTGLALLLVGCGDDLSATLPLTDLETVEEVYTEEEFFSEDTINIEDDREEIPKQQESSTEEVVEGEESEPAEEEAVEIEKTTITISAAGDCSLGNYYMQDYHISFDQTYEKVQDEGYFFQNVKEIFETDDMTIVNLEGVLTTSEELEPDRTYNIKGDPSYVGILTAGSVEAVSMANNHRQDYGKAGTEDTVEALEGAEIVYAYDDIVGIYEAKGIKIGIVSVNEVAWGTGSETFIRNGIASLKEQEADLIIACCHWGVEKDNYTEEYQNELGRICIEEGADLVLGHHPHVLQGIEEYQGKYIVYSLANFCFGANRNPADKDTMIFQQTFTFVEGQLQPEAEARIIPCSVSSVSERNNFQPTPLTGEDAARVMERLNTYSEAYGVVVDEDGTLHKQS